MRNILVHLHIFKNAGTSLEMMLQDAWGERVGRLEAPKPWQVLFGVQLRSYLALHEELVAVTSHTLRPPLPFRPDWKIFPLVFLRHPLDRAASVYEFERSQELDTPGSLHARGRTFEEYLQWRLGPQGETVIKNAQVLSLCRLQLTAADPQKVAATEQDLAEATGFLSGLRVVGLVERFRESVESMQGWLAPSFPQLSLDTRRENSARPVRPLEDKLREIQGKLSEGTYRRLEEENLLDLKLYRWAEGRLEGLKAAAA
jgi:hypothetical protein